VDEKVRILVFFRSIYEHIGSLWLATQTPLYLFLSFMCLSNFSYCQCARGEVYHDRVGEDFACNFCECYVSRILEDVVVAVFRALKLDDKPMCRSFLISDV
jgi:hypothetical protein